MTPEIISALDDLADLDSNAGDEFHRAAYAAVVAAIDSELTRRHAEHINDVACGERRLMAAEKRLARLRYAAGSVVQAYRVMRAAGSFSGFWTHIDDLAKALADG